MQNYTFTLNGTTFTSQYTDADARRLGLLSADGSNPSPQNKAATPKNKSEKSGVAATVEPVKRTTKPRAKQSPKP
jgi:hypothetical protein